MYVRAGVSECWLKKSEVLHYLASPFPLLIRIVRIINYHMCSICICSVIGPVSSRYSSNIEGDEGHDWGASQ